MGCSRSASEAADGLFRLVDADYERRTLANGSNIHPAGFDELMPKDLAIATVDRLLPMPIFASPPGRAYDWPRKTSAARSSRGTRRHVKGDEELTTLRRSSIAELSE